MTNSNIERAAFEEAYLSVGGKQRDLELEDGEYTNSKSQLGWELWQIKAQALPTWIDIRGEEPTTDTMVLICWSDAPDIQPEIDYMTCDDDLNHIWANFDSDPPTHWMHFHKVPSESGAEG
ncbi:hypothetical protein [Acinetobacter calcoaceticus]|uniref:hypothetical protein n=1 Tax=Acinetobacter calcoaceticus TaxID=471 RepID=UPI0002CFAB53|nr:hypothetical protein [Acinetobacter calcoaceticus]ENU07778.1 hypothetical protein F997_03641 [Acinetobacter calcoaceticus NIPH 13]